MTAINMNQNARFVLKLSAGSDSYASIGPLTDISFCGGNAFSISFSLFLKNGSSGSIIEQTDSFAISLSDSQFFFEAGQLGMLKAYLEDGMVIKDEFNCFDITYDSNRLCLYVNAILIKEKTVLGTPVYSTNPLLLGKEYEGYLNKFKITNYALSGKEVAQNAYVNTICRTALEVCLDFSDATPKDIGKNNLPLCYEGFCISKNVVDVLTLGTRGAVTPLDHPVLPADFSVLSKIYLSDSINPVELIFSYGDYGGEESFCIGIKHEETSHAFVRIGEMEVVMVNPLTAYCWLDLTVSIKEKTIRLYLDGAEQANRSIPTASITPGQICIGNGIRNGRIQTMGFSGFIDSVSLFSSALAEQEIIQLVSKPSNILSEHIMAIYSFSQKEAVNLVNGSILNFAGAASIEIKENTVAANEIPTPVYCCPAKSTELSDFEQWEAVTLLDMITTFLQTQHGLMQHYTRKISGRTDYPVQLLEYTAQNVLPMEESQLALSNYTSTNSNHITSLVSGVAAAGFLGVLATALFVGGSTAAKTSAGITALQTLAKGSSVILGLAAIGVLTATIVCEHTDDPPAPPEPKGDTPGIFLKSITFNHNPDDCGTTSAINIKRSADNPLTTPEWVSSGGISYCAYIQSNLSDMVIEVSIQYTNKNAVPCTATITGQADSLLGTFSQNISFSAPGIKAVKLSLPGNSIKTSTIGEKNVKVSWVCSISGGGISYLGNSQHTIFLIPKLPLAPYGIHASEPDSLLHVDMLSFCGRAFGSDTTEVQLQDKLGRYLHRADNRENRHAQLSFDSFLPSNEAMYTTCTTMGVTFRANAYFAACSAGNVSISALDAAAIMALMMRANGYVCNIAKIKSTLGNIKIKNADGSIEWTVPVLFTNQVRPLSTGDYHSLEGLTTHYVNTNTENIRFNMEVYDAYYQVKVGENGLVALQSLPFSSVDTDICMADSTATYREAFFALGDLVNITSVIVNIQTTPPLELSKLEEPNQIGMTDAEEIWDGAIIQNGNMLMHNTNRPNWDAIARNAIYINAPLQARCHSISFNYIQSWTVDIINSRINPAPPPPAPMPDIPNDLNNIITAVFIGAAPPLLSPSRHAYDGAQGQCNIIANPVNLAAAAGTPAMTNLATAANNFIACLSNAIPNLRAGDSRWNSSIQECFDPRTWLHYNAAGAIDNSHTGAALPIWPVAWPPAPPAPVNNRFYLYNIDDCNRIRLSMSIDETTRAVGTEMECLSNLMSVPDVTQLTGRRNIQMIYSSSNVIAFNTVYCAAGGDPIYYYNTVAGVWQQY